MDARFRTIGIISKLGDPAVVAAVNTLRNFLDESGTAVLLDESTAAATEAPRPGVTRHQLGEQSDLAIVVGGDGTLLNVARSLVDYQVPILGVNLGRLGFLADVSPDAMVDRLSAILAGDYSEQERFLVTATLLREGEVIGESYAFNDVVVHKQDVARMIEFETAIDGRFLYTLHSDGLIVATPTGSTAYALSGGGPILEPTLNALVLVPICPHTLSNRPIVVSGDSQVEILIRDRQAQVSCDGQVSLALVAGDRIQIRRLAQCIRIIQPPDHDYFEILRVKLGWTR